jgi:hypothetical protein
VNSAGIVVKKKKTMINQRMTGREKEDEERKQSKTT